MAAEKRDNVEEVKTDDGSPNIETLKPYPSSPAEQSRALANPMNRGRNMESFPTDLTLEIFSRLPAKSVGRFRTLSKQWASMLRSPEFTELFLTRSSTRPRLLFAVERYAYNEWQLFSTPQPQNRYEKSSHVDFHTKFSGDVSQYICSYASGLIYFPDVRISNKDMPLICNPITGMYVRLPDLMRYRKSRGFLGFDPIDKHFKVMSEAYPFCNQRDHHSILTLGTGELSWTSNNTTTYGRSLTEGICISGVLYYLARTDFEEPPVIVCFDVRSEEFKFIIAECFSDQVDDPTGLSLVNYKGKLGGIIRKYAKAGGRRSVELCMWVLEDVEKQEWVNYVYTLPENEVLGSCDFSVAGVTATGDIVLFMKFTCKPFYVFYFNPKRNTLQIVEIQGFGANLESGEKEKRGQVYAFVDHVEDLSVNDAKQLKSSISQVKHICSCCQQKANIGKEVRQG